MGAGVGRRGGPDRRGHRHRRGHPLPARCGGARGRRPGPQPGACRPGRPSQPRRRRPARRDRRAAQPRRRRLRAAVVAGRVRLAGRGGELSAGGGWAGEGAAHTAERRRGSDRPGPRCAAHAARAADITPSCGIRPEPSGPGRQIIVTRASPGGVGPGCVRCRGGDPAACGGSDHTAGRGACHRDPAGAGPGPHHPAGCRRPASPARSHRVGHPPLPAAPGQPRRGAPWWRLHRRRRRSHGERWRGGRQHLPLLRFRQRAGAGATRAPGAGRDAVPRQAAGAVGQQLVAGLPHLGGGRGDDVSAGHRCGR